MERNLPLGPGRWPPPESSSEEPVESSPPDSFDETLPWLLLLPLPEETLPE